MAMPQTITKVKTSLRINHNQLNDELSDWIESGLADLNMCGIENPDETDPLILSALKLFVKAQMTEDTEVAGAYMQRYESQKACLMMAEGYGA